MDLDQFAVRLWGNIYYHPETRKFSKQSAPGAKRGFEHFILEPLYKLYSQVRPDLLSHNEHTLTEACYDRSWVRTRRRSRRRSARWVSTSSR